MKMTDSQRIPAARDKVWAALNDPEVLKRCIPGCESLDMTSPTEMTAAVVIKVGPVKAKFGGKVTLSDIDAPNGYRITGEGSGGVAGFAKGGASVRLEEDGPDATVLHYDVDAQIGGKLAQLGARLIDSTAKKLAGQFFETFAIVVAPAPAGAEPQATSSDAAEAGPEGDAAVEANAAAGEPKKKGWFGGLFSGTTTASILAVAAATALYAHACCLFHHAQAPAEAAAFPICRGLAS